MKMFGIFFEQIKRGQVCAPAKPTICHFIFFIIQFKHPVIAMNRWNKWIHRMHHYAYTAGKPFSGPPPASPGGEEKILAVLSWNLLLPQNN